jgi:hypothetical protein
VVATVDFELGPTPAGAGYTLTEQPTGYVPAEGAVLDDLNWADDWYTQISLPFPVTLYGQTYSTGWVDTNGVVSFVAPAAGAAPRHGRTHQPTHTLISVCA